MDGPASSHDDPITITYDGDHDLVIAVGSTRPPDGGRERVVGADDTEDATAVAFDAATGEEVWRHKLDTAGEHDVFADVEAAADTGPVYVTGATTDATGTQHGLVRALDPASGEPVWTDTFVSPHSDSDGFFGLEDTYAFRTAVTSQGELLVSGTYTSADGDSDTHFRSYDPASGALAWNLTYEGHSSENEYIEWLDVDDGATRAWAGGLDRRGRTLLMDLDLENREVDWYRAKGSYYGDRGFAHSETREEMYSLTTTRGDKDYRLTTYEVATGDGLGSLTTGVPEDEPNRASDLAFAEEEGLLIGTGRTLPPETAESAWTGTVGIDADTDEVVWRNRGEDSATAASFPRELAIAPGESCAVVVGNGQNPVYPRMLSITSLDIGTGEPIFEAGYSENPYYPPFAVDTAFASDGDAIFVLASQYQLTADLRLDSPNKFTQTDWLVLGFDDPCRSRGPVG
ncbi:hypothetical protein BRD56_09035 [Thermoplasmatales archaeon SW_10_69_26]|nr:MAG: hypothetical protein BRD56_09035 [Thermoplasmatales archaeon SW_10_69_26]